MGAAGIKKHIELIRRLSRQGQPLSSDAPTCTMHNPQWFVDGHLSLTRLRLHRRLLFEQIEKAGDVTVGSKAIVLAGPPGSGKSTIARQLVNEMPEQYLMIDADEFKIALLQEAIKDGSYEDFIKPPEIARLEREGHDFFPLELAALAHEESSILAAELRNQVVVGKSNIIVDTVLSNAVIAQRLIDLLDENGYDIRIVDVEASLEVSRARIAKRWEQAYRLAREKNEGLGGRWVPSEYIHRVFDQSGKVSNSEICARKIAEGCSAVSRFQVFRTLDVDVDPTLEFDLRRAESGDE